jgi:hypothetical protein
VISLDPISADAEAASMDRPQTIAAVLMTSPSAVSRSRSRRQFATLTRPSRGKLDAHHVCRMFSARTLLI